MVLAWSLAHGGPAGNFFSGTLYDSIAYGLGIRPPKLADIPDQVYENYEENAAYNLVAKTHLNALVRAIVNFTSNLAVIFFMQP